VLSAFYFSAKRTVPIDFPVLDLFIELAPQEYRQHIIDNIIIRTYLLNGGIKNIFKTNFSLKKKIKTVGKKIVKY